MENILSIAFEAHNDEENHHRRYEVTVGRDLFGCWTVAISDGRTGNSGRELRSSGSETGELRTIIRDRLLRRLSAPKRIGCPYWLAGFSAAPGVDTSFCLPDDIVALFL